jgi:DeoR family transcriptional regulator of aga operon/DeoR family fructose operon transcriptional repressor
VSERLSLPERQAQILALIQEQNHVLVGDLAARFGVSVVTVRNDLEALEKVGHVVRSHGGAILRPLARREPGFAIRQRLRVSEKERIAGAAASLVREGDCVFLDASTTAWYIARQLRDYHELTVVTNGLFVALEFLDSPHVTVIVPGGTLRTTSGSLVGQNGLGMLDKYNVQKGFFGAWGLSLREGLTDVNEHEVDLKHYMVQRCREVIGIMDGSKWGEVSVFSFAPLEQVHRIISDSAVPADMVGALRERGIEVMLA